MRVDEITHIQAAEDYSDCVDRIRSVDDRTDESLVPRSVDVSLGRPSTQHMRGWFQVVVVGVSARRKRELLRIASTGILRTK